VYWPLAAIVPAPELASPPLTDQFTLAAPPLASVAVNCSTAVPELVALHPVQFVSMVPAGVEMEKLEFEELAAVVPVLHPASASIAVNVAAVNRRRATPVRADRASGPTVPIRGFFPCSTMRCKPDPDSHASLTFKYGCQYRYSLNRGAANQVWAWTLMFRPLSTVICCGAIAKMLRRMSTPISI
jgi:hypothetical protein